LPRMKRRIVAQKLIEELNEGIKRQINLEETLILGVVLKGLPVAYGIARMNNTVRNLVPIVAQRPLQLQHLVESYFPSSEWRAHFDEQIRNRKTILIIDDVVNAGFTKQRVESIIHSLDTEKKASHRFAALVLNKKILANPKFVHPSDIFAMRVNAREVECDWGLITVPLWELPVREAIQRCEDYFQKFWLHEKRFITITF